VIIHGSIAYELDRASLKAICILTKIITVSLVKVVTEMKMWLLFAKCANFCNILVGLLRFSLV
jgi:hypothetical protein